MTFMEVIASVWPVFIFCINLDIFYMGVYLWLRLDASSANAFKSNVGRPCYIFTLMSESLILSVQG